MPNVQHLVRDERRDLVELLRGLNPGEWEAPSLCEGWRVRDVVAHVISFDDLGWGGLAGALVRARGNADRLNAFTVERSHDRSPEELVALVERYPQATGPLAVWGGRISLLDTLIHQQDIRRPLHKPRDIPADRIRTVLAILPRDPFVGATKRAKGLRFQATDLDWSSGQGPLVRGPGEAIVMALAGRSPALDDLDGDGLGVLRARG